MKTLFIFTFILFSTIYGKSYTNFSGKVTYRGSHVLHSWIGESTEVIGFIEYENKYNGFSCDIKIPIESFDSKNANRDSNMLIYTNAIDHPNIQFKSDDLEISSTKAKVNGILSFGGESKNISVVLDVITGKDISFSGSFIIRLTDYKIKRPSLFFKKIDDEMNITFSIMAKQEIKK